MVTMSPTSPEGEVMDTAGRSQEDFLEALEKENDRVCKRLTLLVNENRALRQDLCNYHNDVLELTETTHKKLSSIAQSLGCIVWVFIVLPFLAYFLVAMVGGLGLSALAQ